MAPDTNKNLEILTLLTEWKLNKVVLASKMGMPTTTLKNKLNPKQPAYNLTDAETDKLKDVLKELSHDIEKKAKSIPFINETGSKAKILSIVKS